MQYYINILYNKYIMLKTRNRLTKTVHFGKRRHINKRTRRTNTKTNVNKYKKTKRIRRSKTHRIKSRRRAQNGGGFFSALIPEDALNVFRSIPASVGHFSDKLSGLNSPASSYVYPTQQPNVNTISNVNSAQLRLLDLNNIYNNAATNTMNL